MAQRAWVIGNGPSLRSVPLDLLRGEITFAMNRIDLIYPDVEWRPTYYMFFENIPTRAVPDLSSPLGIVENMPEAYVIPRHINSNEHCFISNRFLDRFAAAMGITHEVIKTIHNITWIPEPKCHRVEHTSSQRPTAWHLPNFCNYGGTMNPALQMAFMLGYSPVYVIGADLGIVPIEEGQADTNHFHPDYFTAVDDIEHVNGTLEDMHRYIRREFEGKGREIYNATIGGELNAYERVDIWEVLNGSYI